MTFPEHQVAARQLGPGIREVLFHHVGVARAADAAGRQCSLDQAGTVEPRKSLAAPDIGHAEKGFRHRHPVGLHFVQHGDMVAMHPGIRRDQDEVAQLGEQIHFGSHGQHVFHRRLEIGGGEDRRHQRRDLQMNIKRRGKLFFADIADIIVIGRLYPGPAILALIDHDALAMQQFAILCRREGRRGTERGAAHRDGGSLAFRKAQGIDLAPQMRGGEIGACGRYALIKCHFAPPPAFARDARFAVCVRRSPTPLCASRTGGGP